MLLHGLPRDRRQRQGRASNLSGMVGDALVIRKRIGYVIAQTANFLRWTTVHEVKTIARELERLPFRVGVFSIAIE